LFVLKTIQYLLGIMNNAVSGYGQGGVSNNFNVQYEVEELNVHIEKAASWPNSTSLEHAISVIKKLNFVTGHILGNVLAKALKSACEKIDIENKRVMYEIVSALITHSIASECDINKVCYKLGFNLFCIICCSKSFVYLEVVDLLLDNGVSASRIDPYDNNSLHYLSHNISLKPSNQIEIAKCLIEKGSCHYNLVNYEGNTPLDIAIYFSNYDLARFLMQKDAVVSENTVELHKKKQKPESLQFHNELKAYFATKEEWTDLLESKKSESAQMEDAKGMDTPKLLLDKKDD
jgi:hypothetical protein